MQIRDLTAVQWPPSVWVTSGSNRLTPDLAIATIKDAQLKGEHVALSVNDQGQEYKTTIGPFEEHLARRVTVTLNKAIGKTVQDVGELVVEEIRRIRFDKQ